MSSSFSTIAEAIEAMIAGKVIIMVDDENRENEGDFVIAAEHVTPEMINLLEREGRGLLCVTADEDRMAELGLEPMVPSPQNTASHGTNFTVTVDARRGVTTGMSVQDRCATIRLFVSPRAQPSDFARPGHVFPIIARRGGSLVRAGHTEGSVDLARMAGLNPVAVICEIKTDDGSMARLPDLIELAHRLDCPIVTIKDIMAYRMQTETLVKQIVSVHFRNPWGRWRLTMFEDLVNGETHLAMSMGEIGPEPTLVRVHSQCFTGDTLLSMRCDCGPQLHAAMGMIATEGRGAIVYMHQEGRGIGLKNKLLAYALQEEGKDTVEANRALGFKPDLREYGIGAQILSSLGLKELRLLTNNPRKIVGVEAYGLKVVERVPIQVGHHEDNLDYLRTKRDLLGHLIEIPSGAEKEKSSGPINGGILNRDDETKKTQ